MGRHLNLHISGSCRTGLIFLVLLTQLISGCDETGNNPAVNTIEHASELRAQGKLRDALVVLKNLLQENPKNVEGRIALGRIYALVGDGESAEKEGRAAKELGAPKHVTLEILGQAYLLQAKYNEVFKEIIFEDPSTAATRKIVDFIQGRARLALGELPAAKELLVKALEEYSKDINEERPHLKATEQPEYFDALVYLTYIALREENWDEAQGLVDRIVKIDPEDPRGLAVRGRFAFERGDFVKSETLYQQAFDKHPFNLTYRVGLARAQVAGTKFNEALSNINAVLKTYPDALEANYLRALTALHLKDYEAAKTFADKVISQDPRHGPSYLVGGVVSSPPCQYQ
jgi:tetratricopeptide (TPR) repeat protein